MFLHLKYQLIFFLRKLSVFIFRFCNPSMTFVTLAASVIVVSLRQFLPMTAIFTTLYSCLCDILHPNVRDTAFVSKHWLPQVTLFREVLPWVCNQSDKKAPWIFLSWMVSWKRRWLTAQGPLTCSKQWNKWFYALSISNVVTKVVWALKVSSIT